MKKILFRAKSASDSDGRGTTTTGMKKHQKAKTSSSSSNSRSATTYLGGLVPNPSFSERSERTVSTTASSRSSASLMYPLSPSVTLSPSPLVGDEAPRRRRRRASIQFGGDTATSYTDTQNRTPDLSLSFPMSPIPSSSSPNSGKGSSPRKSKLRLIKKKQQQKQQHEEKQCRRSSMPPILISNDDTNSTTILAADDHDDVYTETLHDNKQNNKSPISQLEQDARNDFNLYCYGGSLDGEYNDTKESHLLPATTTTSPTNFSGHPSPDKEAKESVEEEEEDFKTKYEYEDISVRGYHQRSIVDMDDETHYLQDYQQGNDCTTTVVDVQVPLNDSIGDRKNRLKMAIMEQYGYGGDKNDDEDCDDDHSSGNTENDGHSSATSLDLRSNTGTRSYSFDEWTRRRKPRCRRGSMKTDDTVDSSTIKKPSGSRQQRRASMGEIYEPNTTSVTYRFDGTRQPRRSSMKQSLSSTSSDEDDDGSKRRQSRQASMGEEIDVYLPEEGRTVRRRSSITFGTDDVVEVQPAKELTDDPQSLHYRKQELQVFKQKIADRAAANNGQSKLLSRVLKVKKRHCTRGIERFIDNKTRMEWQERKTTARNVVLGVQGIQQSIGDFDADNLADVYKQIVSEDPQKEAMERAKKDAKVAKRYLRSTKRACRRASM